MKRSMMACEIMLSSECWACNDKLCTQKENSPQIEQAKGFSFSKACVALCDLRDCRDVNVFLQSDTRQINFASTVRKSNPGESAGVAGGEARFGACDCGGNWGCVFEIDRNGFGTGCITGGWENVAGDECPCKRPRNQGSNDPEGSPRWSTFSNRDPPNPDRSIGSRKSIESKGDVSFEFVGWGVGGK